MAVNTVCCIYYNALAKTFELFLSMGVDKEYTCDSSFFVSLQSYSVSSAFQMSDEIADIWEHVMAKPLLYVVKITYSDPIVHISFTQNLN